MASGRIFSCFLIVCGALAQDAPEITTQQTPATFSSRVNLVSVPVVIRDREGHAVGGLKREDFQLFDKNKPQVITKFLIEAPSASASTIPAAAGADSTASDAAGSSAAPRPAPPGRYVAYLFDDINIDPGDLLQVRQAASHHLDKVLDPGTRAGVFTLSGRVGQDFTADAEKLREAMNRIQPWGQQKFDNQDCPYVSYYVADTLVNQRQQLTLMNTDNLLGAIGKGIGDPLLKAVFDEATQCGGYDPNGLVAMVAQAARRSLDNRSQEVLAAFTTMADLVRGMSVLPGSRTIVMASPGFILPGDQRTRLNDLFDKAIRAGVTINTLDVRGLYTGSSQPGDRGIASPVPGPDQQVLDQYADMEAKLDSNVLGEFANATGGTFFHNDNGLGEGLDRLAARPGFVYVLGFSPDDIKYDGSYHALKVKLRGNPKTTVEARLGYWAPRHATDPAEEAREDIKDAVFSSEEIRGVPVKLHTEFFKRSEFQAELTVETRVDVNGLKFRRADDRNRDNLTVVTGLFDENGHYVKGTERTMDMRLRDQTLESARASGLNVKETFDLGPGHYSVRVVVRDSEGRSITAQNAGVEIP